MKRISRIDGKTIARDDTDRYPLAYREQALERDANALVVLSSTILDHYEWDSWVDRLRARAAEIAARAEGDGRTMNRALMRRAGGEIMATRHGMKNIDLAWRASIELMTAHIALQLSHGKDAIEPEGLRLVARCVANKPTGCAPRGIFFAHVHDHLEAWRAYSIMIAAGAHTGVRHTHFPERYVWDGKEPVARFAQNGRYFRIDDDVELDARHPRWDAFMRAM